MTMLSIRRAEGKDAGALAELAERTFVATYAADNTPENLAAHCRETYSESIQAEEIANPRITTLVGEENGELVAYAQLRWGAAPACVTASKPIEVGRFYVDSTRHGTGVARALMTECLRFAASASADAVWLGVWEHNPRAIAFYRKSGFLPVGEHTFAVGSDVQRDVVMVR